MPHHYVTLSFVSHMPEGHLRSLVGQFAEDALGEEHAHGMEIEIVPFLFPANTRITANSTGGPHSGVYTRPGRQGEAAHMHLVTFDDGQPVWLFADQIEEVGA